MAGWGRAAGPLGYRSLVHRLLADRLLVHRLLADRLLVHRLLADRLLADRLLVRRLLAHGRLRPAGTPESASGPP
jgi:hypothetical protein